MINSIEIRTPDNSGLVVPIVALKDALLGMTENRRLGEIPRLVLKVKTGLGLVDWYGATAPAIQARRIIKRFLAGGGYDLWRVVAINSAFDGENPIATVECWGIQMDLGEAIARRELSDGFVDHQITLTNIPSADALTEIMGLNAPSGFTAGSVHASLASKRVFIFSDRATFADLLNKLCDQLADDSGKAAEWYVEGMAVHIVPEVGRSAAENTAGVPLPSRRPVQSPVGNTFGNRIKLDDSIDAQAPFTRLLPMGSEDGGSSTNGGTVVTIQNCDFVVSSAVFSAGNTTITIAQDAIYLPNAPRVGAFFGKSGSIFPVVSTNVPNIIVVSGNASGLNGQLCRFFKDGIGTGLTALDDPAAVTALGVIERVQDMNEIPPFTNILELGGASVDMSDFSGFLPIGCTAIGSPTTSQETGKLFVKYGTSSVRVVANRDEGVAWETTFNPTTKSPVFSVWSSVRLISGKVRLEIEDSDGVIYPIGKRATSAVRELRALSVEGFSPSSGAGAIRLIADSATTEFVVDAITCTNSGTAWEYYPNMGAYGLWLAGAKMIQREAGIKGVYHVGDVFDVSECVAGVDYDEIGVGSWVRVKENFDGVVHRTQFDARVSEIEIDHLMGFPRPRKKIRIRKNPENIINTFLAIDQRPKTRPSVDEFLRYPTIAGKAYVGTFATTFPVLFDYQGNQFVKSVAWIIQKTKFTSEPTTAQWAAAIAAGQMQNGRDGNGVLASLVALQRLSPNETAYIRVLPFSDVNGTGEAGQSSIELTTSTIGGVEAYINAIQANFATHAEGQGKLYVKDPFKNIVSVKSRSFSGGTVPDETVLPFGSPIAAGTDTEGVFYYANVVLDEGHTSCIEWLVELVGGTFERYSFTFDDDIVPFITAVLRLGAFTPPSGGSGGLFDVVLDWHGDEDTYSVGVATSKVTNPPTPPFTAYNGRTGTQTIATGVISFGETLYVRVRGFAQLGATGRESAADWIGAITAPLDSSQYLPDGSVLAAKLVAGAQTFTSNIVWSGVSASEVGWGAGVVKLQDGRTFSIVAGSTGTMVYGAPYYVYFDPSVSTTTFGVTQDYQLAIGNNRLLMAICEGDNGTGFPFVVPANSENLLINAAHINVASLAALSANMGKLTAGEILLGNGTTFGGGYTGLRMFKHPTLAEYYLAGYDGGTEQVKIGSDGKLTAGGGNVIADANGFKLQMDTWPTLVAWLASLASGTSGDIKFVDSSGTVKATMGYDSTPTADFLSMFSALAQLYMSFGGKIEIISGGDIVLNGGSSEIFIPSTAGTNMRLTVDDGHLALSSNAAWGELFWKGGEVCHKFNGGVRVTNVNTGSYSPTFTKQITIDVGGVSYNIYAD